MPFWTSRTSFGPDRVGNSPFGITAHRTSSAVLQQVIVCPFRQCCELPTGPSRAAAFSFCPSCASHPLAPRKRSKRSVRQEKRFPGSFPPFQRPPPPERRMPNPSHHPNSAIRFTISCLAHHMLSVWAAFGCGGCKRAWTRHMCPLRLRRRCALGIRAAPRGLVTLLCTDV